MMIRSRAQGANSLTVEVRSNGTRSRILTLSGTLNYYTALQLPSAYRRLLAKEGTGLYRLVLDLRRVSEFDFAGIAALLEIVRDAEGQSFPLLIADRSDRPPYVATGLDKRLEFLSEHRLKALGV